MQFEICLEKYSGLYVPQAAIRILDDVTGVYVMNKNNSASFRAVKILTEQEDYYIVQKNYVPPADCSFSPLKVYDKILVNPEVAHLDGKS